MPLRLLVIEDREADYELLQAQLGRQGVDASCRRVDTVETLTAALEEPGWDAVVTDYNVPGMGFRNTVELLRSRRPDLPIVLFSGYMAEDQAAELLKAGVTDFVLKYRPARLGSAIRRAVDYAAEQQARSAALDAAEQRLQEALRGLQAANDRLEKEVAARTSELSQQTSYLLALIDNFPFRVWLKDTEGRFLAVNRAYAATYGRTPQQIVGTTDSDLVDEATARERLARDAEVMRKRAPVIRELHSADAARQGWNESYKAPVFDAAGNVHGTIGYSRDITERKAAEQLREEALDSARQLAALRSDFVANMSHEIRTPLNAVLGLAQIGMRENSGRKAHDTFARILDSGQLLLGIVNDVLDFSKIEAGKLRVEQVAFDPRDAIDRAVALTAAAAFAKGLEVRLHEAPDLPSACLGDILRLEQVLVNLLSNAAKFTEAGWVGLAAARESEELVFTIEDSGVGIPASQVERLFQPFEQADGSTTRRFGGTGLGLVITRRLVDMMQGRMRVDSAPGAGARFEVRLPLAGAQPPLSLEGLQFVLAGLPERESGAAEAALSALGARVQVLPIETAVAAPADLLVINGAAIDAQALRVVDATIRAGRRLALVRTPGESDIPASLARPAVPILERPLRVRRLLDACANALDGLPAAGPGLARLAGVRILAAEDNEVNRMVLQEALSGEGAALTVVGDGRALLERLEADGAAAYDLVLTDIQMPLMDGYEAARRISALAPGLPVIGLTARAMAEERSRCLAAGMCEHVAKPIDFDLLAALILRHCSRRRRAAQGSAAAPAPPSPAASAAARGAPAASAAAVDWAALHVRYPGKPAFVAKLLAMTVSTYTDTPQALRAAARSADHDALAFLAHGLKGVGGNIAAASLREQARRTEEAARRHAPDAADCAQSLAEELQRVLAELARPADPGASGPHHGSER